MRKVSRVAGGAFDDRAGVGIGDAVVCGARSAIASTRAPASRSSVGSVCVSGSASSFLRHLLPHHSRLRRAGLKMCAVVVAPHGFLRVVGGASRVARRARNERLAVPVHAAVRREDDQRMPAKRRAKKPDTRSTMWWVWFEPRDKGVVYAGDCAEADEGFHFVQVATDTWSVSARGACRCRWRGAQVTLAGARLRQAMR